MAQTTYLRTLSATTFEGIATALDTATPWHERCDTAAKLVIAALHDVHPDAVDMVELQVGDKGAAIAYRVRRLNGRSGKRADL